jgi:hypothetical protein
MLAAPAVSGAAPGRACRGLVLSPCPGQSVPARPLLIRLDAGVHGRHLRVTLNGVRIGKYFSKPSRHGTRRLSVSASYGLRHGRNRLVVRVRNRQGKLRSRTLGFRVRRERPLAGAGLDRTVEAGTRIYLAGHRSRGHLGPPGSASSSLSYRWTLVSAPGGRPLGAGLRNARSVRPNFLAPEPGRYVIKLGVEAPDGKTGSDLVDIQANPPPAVAVDTMAFGPGGTQSGVQVGDQFYPSRPGAWAQLVTLDRRTLEPVAGALAPYANKSYTCQDPPRCAQAQSDLRDGLAKLGPDDLVIVSSPYASSGAAGITPYGLEGALGRIGVSPTGFDQQATASPGGISAIGVPGTSPGKGNWRSVASAKAGAGRMQDYLIRNNERDYVYTPSERVEFNTQAPGSNATTNVVQIGDRKFSTGLSERGGLQLVVVNRRTLEGRSEWFNTATGDPDLTLPFVLGMLAEDLSKANADGNDLVILASRGVPAIAPAADQLEQLQINKDLQDIADQVDTLGGTRSGIFRALDPGLSKTTSYTLVGFSNAGAGTAAGQESVVDGTDTSAGGAGMNLAAMRGTLAPTGPNYSFEVQGAPTVGSSPPNSAPDPSIAASELNRVLVQPPSEWPENGNRGRSLAISYIGRAVFGTSDPRSQYWTVIYKPKTWSDYETRIGALAYPGRGVPGFTAADLEWAKSELRKEIGWLGNVHSYLEDLAQPFSTTVLTSWAAFNQISNSIRNQVEVGVDQRTIATQKAMWQGVRSILSSLPEAGHAFHAVDAVYETVMQLAELNREPVEDEFQARADELGVKLTERLSAGQEMLTRQIPNTIAADYEKLRTIGSCASKNPKEWPECKFAHADWEFTQDDQAAAAKALLPGMKTWAYGSLLAVRYHLYALPLWWRTNVSDNKDFYGGTFASNFRPFDGLPASAQFAKPIYRNIPTYGHRLTRVENGSWASSGETWQIYALGYLTGDGTILEQWLMHYPKADVTDPIFKPLDQGGLAADPESFFDRFFPKPSTLDHYPERDTPTGWCVQPTLSVPVSCPAA